MASRSASRRRPRPRLGQHFLADPRVRGQILARLSPQPDDCWLEIGAGHGEMTLGLAEASRAVVAVERDPRLAETLRARVAAFPQVRILEADILKTSLEALAGTPESGAPGGRGWRVYGNLPYYITSPILHHLFAGLESVADIHVVVQREVAERLVARPGSRDYGYLSVLTQLHTTPKILQPIPRGAFRPPPRVDSSLVRLLPPGRQGELRLREPANFLRFVQGCFRQKRKTLSNNLRRLYEAERVRAALAAAGLDPRARAEQLPLEQLARLFELLPPVGRFVVGSEPL